MAKIKPGIVNIKGKWGDYVMVDSKAYGPHIRKAPAPGYKKNDPAFKQQFGRNTLLNGMAGELNRIAKIYGGNFKRSDFYQQVQSRLRKEQGTNRFILLSQLKGMEINPEYPLQKLGSNLLSVHTLKNKITVSVEVLAHPKEGKHGANCYYYDVILLLWNKNKKDATHSNQLSEWINMYDELLKFKFSFAKTAGTQHWLLCIRQRLGIDEKEMEAFVAEGMQIIDCGTFIKKDLELLKKREAERKTKRVIKVVQKKEVLRVKGERIKK